MNVEHHTIENEGYHWHVVTSGPEDAPPVLLLHCWTGNWTLWERTMQHLDGQYRFIVPDHLGFGQSDKPRGDHYQIDKQVERSIFILRQFGVNRARVMGHSMGGQIALTLAGLYPDRVERLIVVDPAVTGRMHWLSRLLIPVYYPMRYGITAGYWITLRLGLLAPSIGVQIMRVFFPRPNQQREAAIYWAKQAGADGQAVSSAWAQKAVLDWDVTPLLKAIKAPTLALWGEQDYCVPISECDVLAEHIGDFHAVRIPKVGHFPMIETWDTYIEQVETFFS